MAGEELPQLLPVEASDATVGEMIVAKGSGKGLSWSNEENVALARAAALVCTDPTVGSCMTATSLNKKMRSAFINDPSKPSEACTTRDKGQLDSRRWDGRSYVACGKQWEILRRECGKFKGWVDRVRKMNLTGNPSDEDLYRCASMLYSDGATSISHVYDCVRNPFYYIAKPFKFEETYVFLSTKTTILEAGGVESEKKGKTERPIGTKAAKK